MKSIFGGSSTSSIKITLNNQISGKMHKMRTIVHTSIFESLAEDRALKSCYGKTLGTFNILKTPVLTEGQIVPSLLYLNSQIYSYKISAEKLDYILNPDCGLELKDLEFALEFEVSEAHNNMLETFTGFTFEEIQEEGNYKKVSRIQLENGEYVNKFVTAFVPADKIQGLSFTIPWKAKSVGLKVKAVLKPKANTALGDILFLNTFETDLKTIKISSPFPHIKAQRKSDDTISGNQENFPVTFDAKSNNYPNPFNPQTEIRYNLTHDANVKISVYNIKGQKVKTLVDKHCKKGDNKIVWNGTNDDNQKVGSGIYLYKLESRNISILNKMLMIK